MNETTHDKLHQLKNNVLGFSALYLVQVAQDEAPSAEDLNNLSLSLTMIVSLGHEVYEAICAKDESKALADVVANLLPGQSN